MNGLGDLNKTNKLLSFRFKNQGIYLLQEIHNPDEYSTKRLLHSSSRSTVFIKQGPRASSGVALCIPTNDSNLISLPSSVNTSDGNHRFIHGTVSWFGLKLNILNVYSPSNGHIDRESFFSAISNFLDIQTDKNFILGGDFNCTLDPDLDHQIANPSRPRNNLDQRKLRELLIRHDLVDIWRLHHPTSHQATYGSNHNLKISRLDRFYVSSSIQHLIESSNIIPNTLSDHYPVKISITSPSRHLIHKSTWRLNAKVLLQYKFRSMISEIISQTFLTNNLDIDINEQYTKLKTKLRRNARRYAIGNHNNLKLATQRVCSQIEELESNRINPPDLDSKIAKIRNLKLKLSDLENQAFLKSKLNAATTSADTTEKATKTFFNCVKPKNKNILLTSLKSRTGTIARSQDQISEVACEFYEDLYQNRQTCPTHSAILFNTLKRKVQPHHFKQMNLPITPEEVTAAIKNISSSKAPGPDGLGSEFYKTFAIELTQF